MIGDAVILRNVGTEVFRDRFDGKEYEIKPGGMKAVPKAAAKLWLGDWELSNPRERRLDQERARLRKGRLPELEVADEDASDDNIVPPTQDEEALLKSYRKGANYEFPDGTRIPKKADALAYLRSLPKE